MFGQLTFGWIKRRLKQTTGFQDKLLGGKSVILCGDPAQLPLWQKNPSTIQYHSIVRDVQGNDPE